MQHGWYGARVDDLDQIPRELYAYALRTSSDVEWSVAEYGAWGALRPDGLPDIQAAEDVENVVMVVHADLLRLLWHGLMYYPVTVDSPKYVQHTPWMAHLRRRLGNSEHLDAATVYDMMLALERTYSPPPSVVYVEPNSDVDGQIRFGTMPAVDMDGQKIHGAAPSRAPT